MKENGKSDNTEQNDAEYGASSTVPDTAKSGKCQRTELVIPIVAIMGLVANENQSAPPPTKWCSILPT